MSGFWHILMGFTGKLARRVGQFLIARLVTDAFRQGEQAKFEGVHGLPSRKCAAAGRRRSDGYHIAQSEACNLQIFAFGAPHADLDQ